MQTTVLGSCLLTLLVLTAGCFSPLTHRLPTFGFGPPQVEKKAYELHDPFPDRLFGPDTQVRPRGFNDQRTEPRRAKEGYMLRGLEPQQSSPAPQMPSSGWKYPEVVPH